MVIAFQNEISIHTENWESWDFEIELNPKGIFSIWTKGVAVGWSGLSFLIARCYPTLSPSISSTLPLNPLGLASIGFPPLVVNPLLVMADNTGDERLEIGSVRYDQITTRYQTPDARPEWCLHHQATDTIKWNSEGKERKLIQLYIYSISIPRSNSIETLSWCKMIAAVI